MIRQRAETAAAEAAARGRDGEFYLFQRGNAAHPVVHRMPGALIGQLVYAVELLARQRQRGNILTEPAVGAFLRERLAAHGVLLAILPHERFGVSALIGGDLLEGGDGFIARRRFLGQEARAAQRGQIVAPVGLFQQFGRFHDGVFAHAEQQNVRAAIEQQRPAHGVGPVIVMREAPQRSLHAADDDRHVAIRLADAVAVGDRRPVGAVSRLAAGRVYVLVARPFGHGVVVDHAVDYARADKKPQPRTAEPREVLRRVPVGLRQDAHAVARAFQHAR